MSIANALRAYERAGKNLADAVARDFPVGSRVVVKRHNGRMHAVVFSTPHSWSDPTRLGVENRRTQHRSWVDYRNCTVVES